MGLVQSVVGAAVDSARRLRVFENFMYYPPHVKARENIVTVKSPLGGLLSMVGIVPKLHLTPGAIESAGPPEVGQHNEEIYCGRLGLSRDELAGLRARGVV